MAFPSDLVGQGMDCCCHIQSRERWTPWVTARLQITWLPPLALLMWKPHPTITAMEAVLLKVLLSHRVFFRK